MNAATGARNGHQLCTNSPSGRLFGSPYPLTHNMPVRTFRRASGIFRFALEPEGPTVSDGIHILDGEGSRLHILRPRMGRRMTFILCPGRKARAVAVSDRCVPAAKPVRLSFSVSRRIARVRLSSRCSGRLDGLPIVPVLGAPTRRTQSRSSIRMRSFSIPGPGQAAHGSETAFRRAETISRPPWAATRCRGIRPRANCPGPTDPQSST